MKMEPIWTIRWIEGGYIIRIEPIGYTAMIQCMIYEPQGEEGTQYVMYIAREAGLKRAIRPGRVL